MITFLRASIKTMSLLAVKFLRCFCHFQALLYDTREGSRFPFKFFIFVSNLLATKFFGTNSIINCLKDRVSLPHYKRVKNLEPPNNSKSVSLLGRSPATHPPNAGGFCKNRCGMFEYRGCSCSHTCVYDQNCCPDFQQFCGVFIRNPSLKGERRVTVFNILVGHNLRNH